MMARIGDSLMTLALGWDEKREGKLFAENAICPANLLASVLRLVEAKPLRVSPGR